MLRRLEKEIPDDFVAHANLARSLLAQGRLREARDRLEAARRIAPGDDDTRRELEALK